MHFVDLCDLARAVVSRRELRAGLLLLVYTTDRRPSGPGPSFSHRLSTSQQMRIYRTAPDRLFTVTRTTRYLFLSWTAAGPGL